MGVTKKTAAALAVCALLIAGAGLFGGGVWAAVAFALCNTAVLTLWAADVCMTPRPGALTAERELEAKLSLNARYTCGITVHNPTDYDLYVRLTDDLPEHFACEGMPEGRTVRAHSSEIFRYSVLPQKRGEFALPCITLRYTGVFGFCYRQAAVPSEQKYRVIPSRRELSRYSISALSKDLFVSGIRPVRAFSDDGEFDSLRRYAEGDPFRKVNWAATARSGELTVNTFAPERNQYIYLWLDTSRLMNSRYHGIRMMDYCVNAAYLVADFCLRGGDNVGVLTFGAELERFLKAGKGPGQKEAIEEELYLAESREDAADYSRAASRFAATVRRRSLCLIFTDLYNAEEAGRFAAAVRTHLAGHLVCAVTVRDPRIAEMAEGKTDRSEKDAWLRAAADHKKRNRAAAAAVLRNAGILTVESDPDRLSVSSLAVYLRIKREGGL